MDKIDSAIIDDEMKPVAKKEFKSTLTSKVQLKNGDLESGPESKSDALSALIKICTAIGFMGSVNNYV